MPRRLSALPARRHPELTAYVRCIAILCCWALPGGALAAEKLPEWIFAANAGLVSREGDKSRATGSIALTRKLGHGYVRASVTRFSSSVRQVDVELPSTYTVGFISAGATIGHWFVDGYGALGSQHYDGLRTALGTRAVSGSRNSGVLGAGGDVGYVRWLGQSWSFIPSVSAQYIRSKALREQIGPMGPSEYETRETGATFGATLRLDRWFGPGRQNSFGAHVSQLTTTNASAALSSGSRGALYPASQSARRADGWTEFGVNGSLLLKRGLYLDGAAGRTTGARSGDATTATIGVRALF